MSRYCLIIVSATCWAALGCGGDDGDGATLDAANDAAAVSDANTTDANLACLDLAPATFQGNTPFGVLDMDLDYFASGDCLTITGATVGFSNANGDRLSVGFPYPVNGPFGQRTVTTNFSNTASLTYTPMAGPDAITMGTVQMDVTTWRENGDGAHDIDATLTITEAGYTVAPIAISGTFCDWPALLCAAPTSPR